MAKIHYIATPIKGHWQWITPCGLNPVRTVFHVVQTLKPGDVTCKRCLAKMKRAGACDAPPHD